MSHDLAGVLELSSGVLELSSIWRVSQGYCQSY